ncbi:MAG: chemotaxis protein CheB [Elainellaceae cyanobacterium]
MLDHPIIVIGASAGGTEALVEIVRDLPGNFPSAILVAVHVSALKSYLPRVLSRSGVLPVKHPHHNETIQAGHIYIAPPNHHLLIQQDTIQLSLGPRENGFRPAIDPLLRSAAQAYGSAVVGVILTGALDDGTAGLGRVKHHGGTAVVQDPDTATFSMMPESAIAHVEVDHVVPLAKMAALLTQLAQRSVRPDAPPDSAQLDLPPSPSPINLSNARSTPSMNTPPSGFVCPECGGVLWELQEPNILKLQCRTGHTYSQNGFLLEQSKELEAAM